MTKSAVLLSGGLDSAVLLAMELAAGGEVFPVHVRSGFVWEPAEAAAIERFLAAPPFAGRVRPLTSLAVDMRDVYSPAHWALTGRAPGYESSDEEVFLAGRNIVLTGKAAVFAAGLGIEHLVLGPLAGNPFPDARPTFFDAMSRALSLGLDRSLRVETPLATLSKPDVIRRGLGLGVPLALTMSCLQPDGARHCGQCNKCRERREAFVAAGVHDPTDYVA